MVSFKADEKKRPAPLVMERCNSSDSDSSSTFSLKPPRTPRFAEATAVYSPIEPSEKEQNPFADPKLKTTQCSLPAKPSDVGFGYISDNTQPQTPRAPLSPLKSAMKVPGTPGRRVGNPLSPTFREEQLLERHENYTEKEQAKDLIVKTRVRVAKMCLRCVNFSCSLIVLSMVSVTMRIFFATKSLPAENNLPAWANGTKTWPQIVVLSISSVSLAFCVLIFYGYWKGGNKRAGKVDVYYTIFAVGFFMFSVVMWGIAAGILQSTKDNSGNQDIWGWSCVDNKRRQLFSEKVDYALVCRLQSWSLLCCVIEVVVETMTILIYGIIFYRYYSKRRLRKTMDMRDRARSDLYLAQLRTQSAPNTPGFGPLSPSYSTYMKSPRLPPAAYTSNSLSKAEDGFSGVEPGTRFIEAKPAIAKVTKPFNLQAPPIKIHTPKTPQIGFSPPHPAPYAQRTIEDNEPAPTAPGEQQYEAVPIPGAYSTPASPPPQKTNFGQQPRR